MQEHRQELVPLGAVAEHCDRLAADGWELAGVMGPVAVQVPVMPAAVLAQHALPGRPLVLQQESQPGAFLVFRRPRADREA